MAKISELYPTACPLACLRIASFPAQGSLPTCWLGFGRAGLPPAGRYTEISCRYRYDLSFLTSIAWSHLAFLALWRFHSLAPIAVKIVEIGLDR